MKAHFSAVLVLTAMLWIRGTNPIHATLVQWTTASGGNGHYYAVVDGYISWADAQNCSIARHGYLATLTSAAENSFVFNLTDSPDYWFNFLEFLNAGPWFGGIQQPGSIEPGGGWEWANGEGPFTYTNWQSTEPNNGLGGPTESVTHFYTLGPPGSRDATWADAANSPSIGVDGYVFEANSWLFGDYNFNDVVDAADYVVWRKAVAAPVSCCLADGNFDGDVDQDDYDLWRAHFGETVPSSAASSGSASVVPEPSGLGLLAVFALIALARLGPRSKTRNARCDPGRVRVACTSAVVVTVWCFVVSPGPTKAEYADAVLQDNPIVYYRFNETSLPTAFDSAAAAGNQDGTYVGFGVSNGPGNIGQAGPRPTDTANGFTLSGFESGNLAPYFRPQGPYVERSSEAALNVSGALTLEAWINPDTIVAGNSSGTANRGILAKFRNEGLIGRSYLLYLDGFTGRPSFVVSHDGSFNGSARAATNDSTHPLTTNQWYHVVATYVPNHSMRVWVNAELDSVQFVGIPSSVFTSNAPLWVGVQYDAGPGSGGQLFFDGRIDEAAVYNVALDDLDGDGIVSANNRAIAHFEAATIALQGDYNRNGAVDTADFVTWRKSFGQTGSFLPADGDLDGDVDQDDYNLWRMHFGETIPVSTSSTYASAIPESDALILGIIGSMFAFRISMRRRRRMMCLSFAMLEPGSSR